MQVRIFENGATENCGQRMDVDDSKEKKRRNRKKCTKIYEDGKVKKDGKKGTTTWIIYTWRRVWGANASTTRIFLMWNPMAEVVASELEKPSVCRNNKVVIFFTIFTFRRSFRLIATVFLYRPDTLVPLYWFLNSTNNRPFQKKSLKKFNCRRIFSMYPAIESFSTF